VLGEYGGMRSRHSKRNFVTFVSFCLICSGQYHSGYAFLEDRLMEVNEQSDRDIQQLHVTEELRFAEWMQNLNSLEFHEQAVAHQDIESQWFIKDKPLVFDPN
jgi:hypothetical protein